MKFLLIGLCALGIHVSAHGQAVTTALADVAGGTLAWADVNGDGFDDLLICGQDSSGKALNQIMYSDSNGFDPNSLPLPGALACAAAWGDMDGDGDPDLALAGRTGGTSARTWIYRNDAGVLNLLPVQVTGVESGTLEWADLDGDNDADLLISGFSWSGGCVLEVWKNLGSGNFSLVSIPGLSGVCKASVATGDRDGDGDLDLLVSGVGMEPGRGRVYIYENLGGLNFSLQSSSLPWTVSGSVGWSDCDGDGDLDVFFTGMRNRTSCEMWKDVSGAFLPSGKTWPRVNFSTDAWADMDGDGDEDLVLGGMSPTGPLVTVLGNDNGNLLELNLGLPKLYEPSLAWGDRDNDGDLDLAISGLDSLHRRRSFFIENTGWQTTP